MAREDKINDRLAKDARRAPWTDFTVSEHGELPGPPMLPSGCDTSADVWITDGSRLMTGPVAGGAEQFEAKLGSFVRENRLYGAAAGIVHGGELAWSGGVGFADLAAGRLAGPDVLYRIASITKTFTGTAILQLRDSGMLHLDDPVVKWVPELADSASPETIGAVTIRRLLSHESGLVSEPPGTDFMALPPSYQGVVARNLERVSEIFTAVPPNTQLKYCNLGYQLLGEIVGRVGGIPYAEYVAEHILTPLQMSSTGFEPLDPALAERCAVGYSGRAFSDELSVAPSMPPVWAEGGLWSSVADLGRWLSFQLAAHPGAAGSDSKVADSPVLSAATRREMHKPRYLSDEEWSSAWGVSWYSVRKDDVTWVQHSGGLPGFASNACFDRATRVGAIVLVNGASDASPLAMALAAQARELAEAAPPRLSAPAPTPAELQPLLGLYASADMSFLLRVEWRDGKLAVVEGDGPGETTPLERGSETDSFVVAPGFRESGEPLVFQRRVDGTVTSMQVGSGSLVRLDPVT
jgi:CubicO group peptidase (beta-lactamase class C family)